MKISKQYLAGVADSDGSFTYGKKFSSQRNKYYFVAQFQITWKLSKLSRKFFEDLVGMYGGSFFIGKTRNTYHKDGTRIVKYCVTGVACSKFCEDVLPFLILKKDQAKIVIEGGKLKSNKWGSKGKPESVWKKERKLYELSRELKK